MLIRILHFFFSGEGGEKIRGGVWDVIILLGYTEKQDAHLFVKYFDQRSHQKNSQVYLYFVTNKQDNALSVLNIMIFCERNRCSSMTFLWLLDNSKFSAMRNAYRYRLTQKIIVRLHISNSDKQEVHHKNHDSCISKKSDHFSSDKRRGVIISSCYTKI